MTASGPPLHPPESAAGSASDAHERLVALLAAVEAAEDAGHLGEMEALARDGLAQAIAADAADWVLEFYTALGRRLAFDNDLAGVVEVIEPGLAWLPRARNPVACVGLAGLLALAYAARFQFDRAFGLLRRVQTLTFNTSAEAAYLLEVRLGELNLTLQQAARAAPHLREALRLLDTCAAAQRTPHRYIFIRLLLTSALLLTATADREAGASDWAVPLDDVMQRLDEAARQAAEFPVLAVAIDANRGYCLTLQGRADPALKARLIGLSDKALGYFPEATQLCIFDWLSAEAASGDTRFGHAFLARTDPRQGKLPWPLLKPLWYRALGDVLSAEGDSPAAVQALRQSIVEDRQRRGREISMVVQMGERAARADEIEARERAAQDRAEHLAANNALLAAETQRWSKSALTDALTGLHNRRHLEQVIAGVRSAGPGGNWTVVMIDIDHFKSVNDQHSHAVGDQVLAAVGHILAAAVRDEDVAARWGGEEFVLLLRRQVSEARLDAIRGSVESFDWTSLLPDRRVTISLGAAVWDGVADFPQALALADQRLYAAKRAGRNRVVVA